MFTQNLILELVAFVIICIIVALSIYFKDTFIGYFVKNISMEDNSDPVESIDNMINRIKRSDSIESFISNAVSESSSSIISSVISSVHSAKK